MSTFNITGSITDADGSKVDFTAIDTPDYNKVIAMSGMGSVGALSTAPGGIIVLPTAPIVSNVRTFSAVNSFWNVVDTGTTNSNNLNAHGSSVYVGATVNVSLGGVFQGVATTDGSGNWTYSFGILSDATYVLSATITVAGITSLASSNFNFTIATPISGFTNIVQASMNIDNIPYILFAAGGAGNACPAYSFQEPDTHTLRFEVHQGDRAPGDSNDERCEVGQPGPGTTTWGINNRALRFTHEFLMETGGPNIASGWFIIYQIHNDDVGAGVATSPFISIGLSGAGNTQSPGDRLYVQYRWWNAGRGGTANSNPAIVDAYIASSNITRGVWHTIDVNAFVNNANAGSLQVWIDGVSVVNLSSINLGYGFKYYTEYGIYRGQSSTDIEAIRDRNMLLSLATT